MYAVAAPLDVDVDAESQCVSTPVRRARPPFLRASLAAAVVALGFSGAAVGYAYTHIPEIDADASAAPMAEVAAIAAEAPASTDKLEVLPTPVYGPGMVSEAPAMPFVPLNAKVKVDTVDLNKLAQADGETPTGAVYPCDTPCDAQPATVTPVSTREAVDETQPAPTPRDVATSNDSDDDGNAPPPPDMVINNN